MTRTMAEILREEARLETARRTFIRQLDRRFGDLPDETRALPPATLSAWTLRA